MTGRFIADLVLQVMACFAETERTYILRRQAEGIAAAKAQGKTLGRKPNQLPEKFEEYCEKFSRGTISIRQAAICLGMSNATFFRHFHRWKENKK